VTGASTKVWNSVDSVYVDVELNQDFVWYAVVGVLFISMALAGSSIARLPLTTGILYLGVGALLGPFGSGLLQLDAVRHASALERVTEIAVIISLFTAGLKLRVSVRDRRWLIALRLAVVSMAVTVLLVATAVVMILGVPWGVGIVVGAILAPTDPVLASDVQIEHPFDRNRLRFALTGEASLNDGTALPFLLLGLGMLGSSNQTGGLWWWVGVDVVWSTAAGLALGGTLGSAVGKLVLYLRRTHREALGLDDFLALGLIALSYGASVACHANGFLAVFAAGLALRRVEHLASGPGRAPVAESLARAGVSADDVAAHPDSAPAYMAQAVLTFNEQLERIGEVAIVVVIGSLLSPDLLSLRAIWLAPVLFLIVRPVAVLAGLAGAGMTRRELALSGWFGVRGVGSAYYLAYAITHGLPLAFTGPIVGFTLAIIAASVVVHGVTVTPLMARWGERAPPGPTSARATSQNTLYVARRLD
jgi:NhaP-type Na+/H+ or K+/H+ antiporter